MTGHNGNVHELHAMHCIDWFRLWKINPPAVQREIEAIWESHVIDKVTGETDRPNAGTDRFDGEHFVTACVGLHGHALLNSYQLTGDPLAITQSLTLPPTQITATIQRQRSSGDRFG